LKNKWVRICALLVSNAFLRKTRVFLLTKKRGFLSFILLRMEFKKLRKHEKFLKNKWVYKPSSVFVDKQQMMIISLGITLL